MKSIDKVMIEQRTGKFAVITLKRSSGDDLVYDTRDHYLWFSNWIVMPLIKQLVKYKRCEIREVQDDTSTR